MFSTISKAITQQNLLSSAEKTANSDDILTEIFLCLPLKSLVTFRYVSKHWLSLISHPNFSLRLHLKPRPISGLILRSKSSPKNPKYDLINLNSDPFVAPFRSFSLPPSLVVLQSCNGLLLCGSPKWCNPTCNCYIINPITKKYTELPGAFRTARGSFRAILGINLAFDPSISSYYKVICVTALGGHCQIQIYSSKTGDWTPSTGKFWAKCGMTFKDGVFWNGGIHWISSERTSLYFNVNEEKLQEMPMPCIRDRSSERRFMYFGESRGHLHLIEIYSLRDVIFDVYEMERDYSGWVMKYHVDLREVAIAFPEMVRSYIGLGNYYEKYSILCVVREEKDEDSYMVIHVPKKAIRYNFKDRTFKKLHDFEPGFDDTIQHNCFSAFQYTESLAHV
ncbi:F-box protein At5g07610-like isoform X1 [Pistacia vera]|uniref:F-box protein At5g07610-like isoform X1 n=1 Tax=Pistacia vera TaxID=55513 RepID=UPI0012637E4F|nr:F-box protein At5g07610-like isoform X1 [Pistacia vera]XP_031281987.1 F-box protein At5g07610-like isoform X1 [Pistacia vera]